MSAYFGLPMDGCFVFRIWSPEAGGPVLGLRRGDDIIDVTCRAFPTMRDLLELDDPVGALRTADGPKLCSLADLAAHVHETPNPARVYPLAPCDLQAIKACGVTFAVSMLERVIEEQAKGDPVKADDIRATCQELIGDSLRDLVPGSEQAMALKAALIEKSAWSQYLEVGIGPDAEVFTKAQPMSSVGAGARIGLHPISDWNNPEPEVVLAVDSKGRVKGATLGNDVNLRDVEGRSALLLGKAKDNNAACAIGPAIRLFDESFGIDDIRMAEVSLQVEGPDAFQMVGVSQMSEISRDPLDLVSQTTGPHHQYPDGFMLFLGTLFVPTKDRRSEGDGFTHEIGDEVTISSEKLGALTNTVHRSPDCPPWAFGAADLMRNLAARQLI